MLAMNALPEPGGQMPDEQGLFLPPHISNVQVNDRSGVSVARISWDDNNEVGNMFTAFFPVPSLNDYAADEYEVLLHVEHGMPFSDHIYAIVRVEMNAHWTIVNHSKHIRDLIDEPRSPSLANMIRRYVESDQTNR
jgi:hypothetical protein